MGMTKPGAVPEYIAALSREIPWHLSAYHPDYRWDAPPTKEVTGLTAAAKGVEVTLEWTDPTDEDFAGVNITFRPKVGDVDQPIWSETTV